MVLWQRLFRAERLSPQDGDLLANCERRSAAALLTGALTATAAGLLLFTRFGTRMSFLREREHLRRLPLPLSALALFGGGVGVSLSLKPCATEILRLPRDSALRKDLLTTVVRWNADLRDQIELLEESKLRQEAMRAQQQEPQPELQSQQPPPPLPPASGRPSP